MQWEQLTTKAFREQVVGRVDTALLPVGGISAHGPHSPLGTDNLIVSFLCQAVEAKFPDRVVALPPISYGCAWDWEEYAGTVSIPAEVFTDYVVAVGRGAARWGIRYLVLINGHGGNRAALSRAQERLAEAELMTALVSWRTDFEADIRPLCSGPGHAGEDETSLMLAVAPSLVQATDAAFNPVSVRHAIKGLGLGPRVWRQAMSGDARAASRTKGEAIAAACVRRLAELLDDLWAGRWWDAAHPSSTPGE